MTLRIAPPHAFLGDDHTFWTNTWLNFFFNPFLTNAISCTLNPPAGMVSFLLQGRASDGALARDLGLAAASET
jgi:hypothetical protein